MPHNRLSPSLYSFLLLLILPLPRAAATDIVQQWPHYRATPGGSGFSPLTQINADNVGELEEAWRIRTGDSAHYGELMQRTSTEVTPILLPQEAGGHLVFCTPFNRIIALNPATGKVRWSHDPKVDLRGKRALRCRGVSYWADPASAATASCAYRVITATHDRRLVAVDAHTGEACEQFGKRGEVRLYSEAQGYTPDDISSSSAPVVVNGVIVTGSAVIDFERARAPQGEVKAYSAASGKFLWAFHPIPRDATSPVADNWPADAQSQTGGANAWAPLSVDEERGWVFVPTGSASPDYFGGLRPGDNRYANSVVALNGATGEVIWHYQLVHHDLWDYDTPAQPMLVDVMHQGQLKPAVIQVTKQGLVFVLDRETGVPLIPVEERPVSQTAVAGEWTSPTQPFPIRPAPLLKTKLSGQDAFGFTRWDRRACAKRIDSLNSQGLFTPITEQKTLMLPGSLGGANWGGGVFWQEQQLLVVNVNTAPFEGQLIRQGTGEAGDHVVAHGREMRVTMQGTPYVMSIDSLLSPLGVPCTPPPWGKLVAIDMSTGEQRWESALGSVHELAPVPLPFEINWGTPNLGGAMMTAGGLVFIGATMDRRIRAFDTQTGEILWSSTLPVDATASPMTYQVAGKQYVVIAAGGHHMFQRGSGDYLIAYALDND